VSSGVRARPASSTALSAMNHNHHNHQSTTPSSSSSSSSTQHLSVLAKVLRLFRSHSDSSMARPPSPPRRRGAAAASSHGPSRSASASPISAQQQVGRPFSDPHFAASVGIKINMPKDQNYKKERGPSETEKLYPSCNRPPLRPSLRRNCSK